MSRPRNKMNAGLPDNLYRVHDKRTDKTYYTYRDPRSGKRHGLGDDRETAISDAKALNAAIYASVRAAKLEALANPQPKSPSMKKVVIRHLQLCETVRKLSDNTMRSKKSTSKFWLASLGEDTPISSVSVRDIVEVLETYADRPRMAQSMRSAAIDIWKDAMQEGWVSDNIPLKSRALTVEVQRSRLTLDDFNKIHAVALKNRDKWIVRAMELALVTAQRREDVSAMQFKHNKDATAWADEYAMCVIQGKTGNKLRIPLDVGVNGLTVGGVIKACRDSAVSKWIIHHSRPGTKSQPGDQVWIDTISRRFADMRDAAGVTGEEGKTPPTFHEIRSLAIRLYADKFGPEFAQAIAGHKDAAMTAVYRDTRGAEWVQVKAG
jgi:integrase